MRRRFDRRCIGIVLGLLASMSLGGDAFGQIETGPFINGDPWYLGPGGILGVQAIGTDQIKRLSDGSIYDLPLEVQEAPAGEYALDFRLSPSQQHLYVQKSNPDGGASTICGGFPNVEILMYEFGPPPTLHPFTYVTGTACLEGTLGRLPEFFDRPGPVRTMFMAGKAGGGAGNQYHQVLWADLIGREIAVNENTFFNGINVVQFSPSGEAAFITHAFSPGPNKYTFVDLCADGGRLGGVDSTWDLTTMFDMWVIEPTSGNFFAERRIGGVGQPNPTPMSTDCYGGPIACCHPSATCDEYLTAAECAAAGGAPVPGDCASAGCEVACCLPDGSCGLFEPSHPACVPQYSLTCSGVFCPQPTEGCCTPFSPCFDVPAADCVSSYAGVPQGPGTECFDEFGLPLITCPVLSMSLTKSGPAQVRQGETFDYTIDYLNDGDLLAPAVVIHDYLPSGLTFVSASHGGQDVGFNDIEWSLGDVPTTGAGSSGQLTVTVKVDCGSSSVSNTAMSTILGMPFISNTITTQILPASPDAVTVTVSSVPQNGLPVQGGDLITHTITLVNAVAELRPGIQFGISAGAGMTFETLIDDGGGVMLTGAPTSWYWTGDLGPSASVDVVLTSRVDACVNFVDVGLGTISVMNACGKLVGSADPARLPVRRAVEVDIVATSLNPPATIRTFTSQNTYQLLRRGDSVDFRFTATNPHPNAITVSITVPIPFGFDPAGPPPFIPPTDPAAIWNAAAGRIEWNGTMAPQQTVTISYRATQTAAIQSSALSGSASDGTCNMISWHGLAILPVLPAVPYVIGLYEDQLWTLRAGIDTAPQNLFPFNTEYVTGMGRRDRGDIWITPLPTFRINPETLELQGFELDLFTRLGFTPSDVAVDPADGTVLFGGGATVGFDVFAAIRRYDPVSDTVTVVYDEPGPSPIMGGIAEIVVEPTGEIGFRGLNRRLYRLGPGGGTPTDLSDNNLIADYGPLAIDEGLSYLVCADHFGGPHSVADVVPDTGGHTIIAPDLQTLLPSASLPPRSMAAGTGGDAFFSYSGAGLGVLHRQPSLSADELLPFDFFQPTIVDLAFSAGPCSDTDGDGVPAGPGCMAGTIQDCDGADPDIYPGAPEINDGKDNQCPGDPGAGAVDELSGLISHVTSGDLCWTAQGGATLYEVVRSTTPDFSSDCNRWTTANSCWTDSAQPPSGVAWDYLVRPLLPFPGSFGFDSLGAERIVSCP